MRGKKPTNRQHQRPASLDTYAAMDAAMSAARARFDPVMAPVFARVKALLLTRQERQLTEAETVQLTTLQARFEVLSLKQQHFTLADLADRLGSGSGEMAGA